MNEIDINPAAILNGHQHMAGMWMFSYNYMYSNMQNNYSGTTKVSDQTIFEKYVMSPTYMRMDMHMLMGMYGISNKLSLMFMVNYLYMNMNMKMLSGQMNMNNMPGMGSSTMDMTSTSQGFGDTKISGMYNLLSKNCHSLIADIGLSIPTGSINKTDKDYTTFYGQKQAYNMQTGSGTFDFMPGITYVYRQNSYALGAQTMSVIHPYYNSQGYKLGNELTLNTWAAYEWWQRVSASVRLNYNVVGQIQGSDASIPAPFEPATDSKNYGGSQLKSFIGLVYFFHDDFLKNDKIAAEYGIPLYQNFNGTQTATNYNLIISWVLTF